MIHHRLQKALGLLLSSVVAVATGCGEKCPPSRCVGAPPLVLTVTDKKSAVLIPSATIEVNGSVAALSDWCSTNANGASCTHAIQEIPGLDDKRVGSLDVEPGYGNWIPSSLLSASVTVAAFGYSQSAFSAQLDVTECGSAVPQHWTVALTAAGEQTTDAVLTGEIRLCGTH
ncbi:MAG: hypothetical protein ACK2UO_06325 [Caldilineaceae bacterium]